MNRIEMYASSTHLKTGLHRVIAVSHALTQPLVTGQATAWWYLLRDEVQERARTHTLALDDLAEVYAQDSVVRVVDAARESLSLPSLDRAALASAFRAALISGKAHRAHMGRDVYGASNKNLWDIVCRDFGVAMIARYGHTLGDEPVPIDQSRPASEALSALRTLVAFDTGPEGSGHDACVDWLTTRLISLGFSVETLGRERGQPLILARREARGCNGHVALYGHYDVSPCGSAHTWRFPPHELTAAEGRLFGRGVADNKGPLACRLAALGALTVAPALTYMIQGEEETGSSVAAEYLPEVIKALQPTIWLDETGYHDHQDGTMRLLSRVMGPDEASHAPDAALDELLRALRGLASRWGVAARHECRGLNKNLVESGCPFTRNLPLGARYLAVGVNDSRARIHGRDESVPEWTFPLHVASLDLIFQWADRQSRSFD